MPLSDYQLNSGRIAYNAYTAARNTHGITLAPFWPFEPWDDLTPEVQLAWVLVVDAVIRHECPPMALVAPGDLS